MNPLQRAAQRASASGTKQFTLPQLLPPYKAGVPLASDWNTEKGIREGYKSAAIVYMCVRLLMQSCASLPWQAFTRKGPGAEWEPAPGHPLEQLMEYPNPFMSRRDLMEAWVSHLALGGNGLGSLIPGKVKGQGREVPVEIWPINPGYVKPVPHVVDFITKYRYENGGVVKEFESQWMIHMMLTDPANPYWGMAPLQAAAFAVDTDVEAVKWNQVTLANRAITDGIFAFDMPLTREQWEEAREQVRQQYAGSANARTPWVLGNKASYHQMSLTPVEMDFMESRGFNREEIAGVFQTPLPMIVAQSDSTYANYATARRAYWGDTIIPFMETIAGALNRRLVPYFGKKDQLYLDFDTSAVEALREDLAAKVEVAQKMVNMGIPLNVVIERTELDVDPVPGGDIGLVPAGVVPIELAGAPDPGLDDTTPDRVVPTGPNAAIMAQGQAAGLNGAQVTALVNIVLQVAQDGLPVNSASAIIAAAFPQLDAAAIKRILAGVPGYAESEPAPTLPALPHADGEQPKKGATNDLKSVLDAIKGLADRQTVVNMPEGLIHLHVEPAAAPIVHVEAPVIHVAAPPVPNVTVTIPPSGAKHVTILRDKSGQVTGAKSEEK